MRRLLTVCVLSLLLGCEETDGPTDAVAGFFFGDCSVGTISGNNNNVQINCDPNNTGSGTGQPLEFDCIIPAGTDSSCNLSFLGGSAFDVHVVCAATNVTPAIDTTTPGAVSGTNIDPIKNAGGSHQCSISLEINGDIKAGPVVKTFSS